MAGLPLRHRLLAPEPGWTAEADVVVVGLRHRRADRRAAARRTTGGRVLLVTKTYLDAGSTRWAQGGIAAALGPDDTPERAPARTRSSPASGSATRTPCGCSSTEGPARVRELIALGAEFDRDARRRARADPRGRPPPRPHRARRRRRDRRRDRAGADRGRCTPTPASRSIEHALVLDLLRDADGRAAGVTLHVIGEGAARRRRRGARPGGRARHRRPGPGLRRDHQPVGVDRRRRRAGAARRRRR